MTEHEHRSREARCRQRNGQRPSRISRRFCEVDLLTQLKLQEIVTFHNRIAVSPILPDPRPNGFANDWHLCASRQPRGSGACELSRRRRVVSGGAISRRRMWGFVIARMTSSRWRASRSGSRGGAVRALCEPMRGGRQAATPPWKGGAALSPAEGELAGGWSEPRSPSAWRKPLRLASLTPEDIGGGGSADFRGGPLRGAAFRQALRTSRSNSIHGYLLARVPLAPFE